MAKLMDLKSVFYQKYVIFYLCVISNKTWTKKRKNILQLSSIKDVENKSTLLHYLVDIVEKNYPELITFGDELTHCDRAARVSMDLIHKTLRIMDTSLRNLDVDLANNSNKQQCNETDLFVDVMSVSNY